MENRTISHPFEDKGPLICVGIWKGIDQRALSNNVVKVLFAGGNRKTQQLVMFFLFLFLSFVFCLSFILLFFLLVEGLE